MAKKQVKIELSKEEERLVDSVVGFIHAQGALHGDLAGVAIARYTNQSDYEEFSDMYPGVSENYEDALRIIAAVEQKVFDQPDIAGMCFCVDFKREAYLRFLADKKLEHSPAAVSQWAVTFGY